MDAAKKKALFRAKLNAQKKETRIDSPLVRYNEFDQPLCRICNVILKSESMWDAHQASRKHHEAINDIKANAAFSNAKPEAPTRIKQADNDTKYETSARVTKPQPSSVLPTDFFDNNETESNSPNHANKSGKFQNSQSSALPSDFFDNPEAKRQKTDSVNSMNPETHKRPGNSVISKSESLPGNEMDGSPSGDIVPANSVWHAKESIQTTSSEAKRAKGALPEGFFDDKEADLRARGIKLVKPDVKDEYKEYEMLIQEDLQVVDDRLEEEEIDAAETIEEAETLEQRFYRQKVESLKKKKMEVMAARSAKRGRDSGEKDKASSNEDSSCDDDDDNFAVDWRAQHL